MSQARRDVTVLLRRRIAIQGAWAKGSRVVISPVIELLSPTSRCVTGLVTPVPTLLRTLHAGAVH